MPYKDKEKATGASKLRMQKMRQGVTTEGVTMKGVTWETMPLTEIKQALPQDIIDYIENVSRRYGLRGLRLRRAYKYQVWHDENFINGIHKDSKYRQFVEAASRL